MPVWLTPTVRSISWWPLAAVTACLAVITAVTYSADFWPVRPLSIAAAALAAAVVAGMRDPAASLLAAVPTSAAVRRARRLALLLPVELAVWVAWLGIGQRWDAGWAFGGLVALTLVGLAVALWAPGPGGLAAGVAVPLAWVIAARAGQFAWDPHSEIVTIAAAAALWTGRNR